MDLRSLLDDSCQRALSLLAAADVKVALERLAQDVKKNANALCMQHISGFTAPSQAADQAGLDQVSAPNGPEGHLSHTGDAPNGPGAASDRPMAVAPCGPNAIDYMGAGGGNMAAAARPAGSRRSPPPVTGVFAAMPAVNSPSNRAEGAGQTSSGAACGQEAASAQRALWPDSDDYWVTHVTAAADQPGPAAHSPGAGALATANLGPPMGAAPSPGQAFVINPDTGANAPAGNGAEQAHLTASASHDCFGEQSLPANMSPIITRRLRSVIARHQQYLRAEDFDSAILSRLASMAEQKAMGVLNQADSANWPMVKNNTKMIMSWCCKQGGY